MARGDIDVSAFEVIVDKALEAFSSDIGYTEQMVTTAVAIERKRRVWQLRLELRAASLLAREECAKHSFVCDALSPCGFGDCRFATMQTKAVVISTRGRQTRVQVSAFERYDLEQQLNAELAVAV